MDRRGLSTRHILTALLGVLVGCQSVAPTLPSPTAWIPNLSSFQVPASVQRLVVIYPNASAGDMRSTYQRLEGATFQLKALRPSLRIVDRANIQTILNEQRRQYGGGWSDESAIRLGHLLGADSVLLYQVETPSLRDQVLARFRGDLPPVMVISKIILVESAEVVFYNVVTTSIEGIDGDSFSLTVVRQQPFIHAALDRSLVRTITDLQQAFR